MEKGNHLIWQGLMAGFASLSFMGNKFSYGRCEIASKMHILLSD